MQGKEQHLQQSKHSKANTTKHQLNKASIARGRNKQAQPSKHDKARQAQLWSGLWRVYCLRINRKSDRNIERSDCCINHSIPGSMSAQQHDE